MRRPAVDRTLAAGEQALLLLNRRGYAPFLLCHDCGATLRCPNCDITLTYSLVQRSLRCHYCDFRQAPPDGCNRCGGAGLFPEGMGTERLEEELGQLFPDARLNGHPTRRLAIDEVNLAGGLLGGRPVVLVIEDNGPGIPPDRRDEVFRPFFTTKHRGSGLGLAIAKRILDGHGGTIAVENVSEGGARVCIGLPADASPGLEASAS